MKHKKRIRFRSNILLITAVFLFVVACAFDPDKSTDTTVPSNPNASATTDITAEPTPLPDSVVDDIINNHQTELESY